MKKIILALLAVMLLAAACGKTETSTLDKNDPNNPYQPVANHDPSKVEKIVDTKGNSIPGDGMVTFDTVTKVRILALPGSPVLVTDKYFTFLFGASNAIGIKNIVALLEKEKIQTIDYVILSTNSDDEVSGVMELMKSKVKVGNFGLLEGIQSDSYMSMLKTMREKMQMNEFEKAGGKWILNGCMFEVLYPMTSDIAGDPDSTKTCIMRLEKDGVSMILTGQMDELIEKKLLERNKITQSTYIVATNGAPKGSLSQEFLDVAKPEKIFIGQVPNVTPQRFGIQTQTIENNQPMSFVLGKNKTITK
jgi:hypothetical protein